MIHKLIAPMVFERRFRIWMYTISHLQLLLRSTREENKALTRIDILFKGVSSICIPTAIDHLSIVLLKEVPAALLEKNMGVHYGDPSIQAFQISGDNCDGHVLAHACYVEEDTLGYHEPSALTTSMASPERETQFLVSPTPSPVDLLRLTVDQLLDGTLRSLKDFGVLYLHHYDSAIGSGTITPAELSRFTRIREKFLAIGPAPLTQERDIQSLEKEHFIAWIREQFKNDRRIL